MLAIAKRFKKIRAISAGSLAFAVGLTASAAYISSVLIHENFTYNREQSAKVAGSSTSSEPITVDGEDGQDSGVPGSTAGAALMNPSTTFGTNGMNPIGTANNTVSGVVAAPATEVPVQPAPQVDPNLPDPSTITPPPTPNPVVEVVEPVVDPVVEVVEPVADQVGL